MNKKLIYISHWRFPSEKTMSPLIMRTCQEFADQGFEVELWVPNRSNSNHVNSDPFNYHQTKRNFKLIKLPVIDPMERMGGKLSFFILLLTFNIVVFAKAMFSSQCIYYSHDLRDVFLLSLLKRNFFIEIHDFYESKINFINRIVINRTAGIISTNSLKASMIIRKYDVPSRRVLWQPNAVDARKFDLDITKKEARKRLSLPGEINIVLYTGSLFYWKGVDTLLASANHLSRNTYVYFVGGTDGDIEKFKVEAQKFSNVVVVGRKPHKDMPLWQKAADVLVLPNTARYEESRVETSPVKLFEYLASSRPLVASDIPAIRDIISENEAIFFKPDDPLDLASKINKILETGYDEKKIIQAKKLAYKNSWESRIESIRAILKAK